MEDKVLVEIFLPATNVSYDVYIPLRKRLGELLPLLSQAFTGLSGGHFVATEETIICDKQTGVVLDISLFPEELGLHNGSKLMLI